MKRPGTGSSYRRLLDRVRARVPGVALRTTLIVGFPGETPEEFRTLEAFVRDVGFDHLGVFFPTKARRIFCGTTPARVKRQRRHLMSPETPVGRPSGHASGSGGRIMNSSPETD
jgi:ribosomal protein S12 methylthiotransferase